MMEVVSLAEDNVILMGYITDGKIIEGEHKITQSKNKIKRVYYKEKAIPTKEALKSIEEADLIVLSMSSLFTSIIPNLLIEEVKTTIEQSKSKIMHVI